MQHIYNTYNKIKINKPVTFFIGFDDSSYNFFGCIGVLGISKYHLI